MKTRVNRPDFFEKLGFQDKIFIKDTILFIPSKDFDVCESTLDQFACF